MEIKSYNIICVGVGGQGVIRVIQILSNAAMIEGFKVRTAETHGMAQRGGSVAAYLRFGTSVEGPLIPRGRVNVVLAFEMSEAVRNFNYAGPNTFFFINNRMIIPPMINQMKMEYPSDDEIYNFLKLVSPYVFFIKAEELAKKSGSIRAMNVVMLGVILGAGKIPIKRKSLEDSIFQFIPKKVHDINKEALQIGIEKGNSIMRDLNV
ncbi:MAG: indolepyruvate oxidoreductase subunit beta [Candidatus Hodarchaeota archaeon]